MDLYNDAANLVTFPDHLKRFNPIQDGGGEMKKPPTSFSFVTSKIIGISSPKLSDF